MLTMTPALLVNTILVRQYLVPLAGPAVGDVVGGALRGLYFAGSWSFSLVAVLGAAGLGALGWIAARRPRHGATWLFAAATLTAAAAYIGGIELAPDYLQVLHAERYSYMPNALLPMALVAMLPYVTGPLARGLIRLGLWMAVLSLVGLTVPVETFARGPDWRAGGRGLPARSRVPAAELARRTPGSTSRQTRLCARPTAPTPTPPITARVIGSCTTTTLRRSAAAPLQGHKKLPETQRFVSAPAARASRYKKPSLEAARHCERSEAI